VTNPRKLITAAVATYLKTPDASTPPVFLTDSRGRVTDTDATPPDADDMPETNVVFIRETIDKTTQHQAGLGLDSPKRRVMEMRIECYHTASKDAADDLAWQTENALQAFPTLGDKVETLRLDDIDLFVVENATLALFAAIMTYEVVYWTHQVPDGTGRPVTVLLGFVPETGLGHEPDYSAIIGGD
jgi:hypothetical protein